MKQYIITEELLKQFEKACPRYSTTPDHFIIDRDTMVAEVRSHLYNPQAEREKVLDVIVDWEDEWFPETGTRNTLEDLALKKLNKIIVELREGWDGE
jgi:hypothetical protein